MRQAKAPADDAAVAEQALDLTRRGAGGEVEILGSNPEQQVADTAAHQVRLVAIRLEPMDDLERILIDCSAANTR